MFPINAFIDTGATVSLISIRTVHMIGLSKQIEPTTIRVTGLGNTIVPMRGEISIRFQLSNLNIIHRFLISDTIDTDFLIGMDIIESNNINIDITNHCLILPSGANLYFINQPRTIPKRMKIKCKTTTVIPANTALFLQGKIPINNCQENYEGLIEPFNKIKQGVIVTGTISFTNKNIVPVHCINPGDQDLTIHKNQIIAFIEPFEPMKTVEQIHKVTEYDSKIDLPRLPHADPVDKTIASGKWKDPSELINQLNIDKLNIPDSDKSELKDLIIEFQHIFSRDKHDLGKCSFYQSSLQLNPDSSPKWIPTRPISHKMQPQFEEEIENLKKSGQISPCKYSLWNSAVFGVQKPNGKGIRFVVDARAINSQIVRDCYELPKISNLIDKISECQYWSSLDMTSSFTQIELRPEDRHITAFTYNDKRYVWNRMIQGQSNSSAEFSRALSLLFNKIPFNCLLIYIDDILLSSNTIESHLKRLRIVFQRLEWGNLKLSPMKTNLLQKEVSFLGFKLTSEGLQIDPKKAQSIKSLPQPTSVKHVQKFLGMVNYHKKFIPQFSKLAAPLYNLLRKTVKFTWDNDCQKSFDHIKDAMISPPILGFPDTSDPFESYEVVVDSSKLGHGAVLSQFDGKRRKIISYFSKAVQPHHRKLGATMLETYGLIMSLNYWRLYLQGTKFKVMTDCSALLSIKTIFSKGNAYMARRLASISDFTFTIHHVSGQSQEIQIADYLSRYGPFITKSAEVQTQTDPIQILTNIHEVSKTEIDMPRDNVILSNNSTKNDTDNRLTQLQLIPKSIDSPNYPETTNKLHHILSNAEDNQKEPITIHEIKLEYNNDKILLEVIEWVKSNKRPLKLNPHNTHAELFHYYKNFQFLSIENDILYIQRLKRKNYSKNIKLIVIPYTLIERVLYTSHNTITSCHAGIENSIDQCLKRFYFYKLKDEFELWIKACLTCNRAKQIQSTLRAPLKPIIYSHPFQAIQIDHLEVTKKPTPRGNVAILALTDLFSGYLVTCPVKSVSTDETIQKIIENWITKFGVPAYIHHDQGTGFTSKLFKAILKVFDIKDRPGTPYCSQTQGKIESQNKRLNVCFRATLPSDQLLNYDLYLKYITMTLNSLKSSRTQLTANFIMFGREIPMPQDLFLEDNRLETIQSEYVDPRAKYAYELYKKVRTITRQVHHFTKQKVKHYKTHYDLKANGPFFTKGEYCLLLINCPKSKYSMKYAGPYLITRKLSDWNYIVNVDGNEKITNISKMKKYTINKYSKLPKNPIVTKKVAKPPVTEINSDQSDESDTEITISFPQIPRSTSNSQQNDKDHDSSSPRNNTDPQDQNTATNDQNDNQAQNETLSDNNENQLTSDNEQQSDNDLNEAISDANLPANRPTNSHTDHITLPEIDKHARNIGVRPGFQPTQPLSRSTGQNDLSNNTTNDRSNATRYSLRKKPAKTSRFGIFSPTKKKPPKK